MSEQMEKWIMVEGVDNEIYVSNFGNVKNRTANKMHSSEKFINGYMLKPQLNNTGYYQVTLVVNKKPKKFLVHRLVAEAFIHNHDKKPHINHIDNNPKNNRVENLEWVTHKENIQYAAKLNRMISGENQHMAKLTNQKVLEIIQLQNILSQKEIAAKMNVTPTTVHRILCGKTWTRITGINPDRKTA